MTGPPPKESELLEACQAGDASAAEALVALHQRAVHRVVGRLAGRWDAADDIVQETFVRAFAHIQQIDPARGALGWLLRTAASLCRDYARHSARREVPGPIADEAQPAFTSAPADLERSTARADLRRRVDRALGHLSPKLREVVVLHYIEELPFSAIASIVGTPVPALKVRALRARAQLRKLLAQDPA